MRFFLVVYDRKAGLVRPVQEYTEDSRDQAMADRFKREMDEKENPDIEVVLLGAESLDALKRTHARYFKTKDELVRDLGDALDIEARKAIQT